MTAINRKNARWKALCGFGPSQRNLVFFKNQTLTIEEQKLLADKLGKLPGRPEGSGLHIHPSTVDDSELGNLVSVISSLTPEAKARSFGHGSQFASREWHSDITFEPVPSDFAILKIHTLPEVGGDTVWASAYEVYDRLSPAFAKHPEGLTALHDASVFQTTEAVVNNTIHKGLRGHALNVGTDLRAVHPVIRTNPVTGWKGLFVNRAFTKRIIELSYDESAVILEYLFRLTTENHNLQVRYRWENAYLPCTFDGVERKVGMFGLETSGSGASRLYGLRRGVDKEECLIFLGEDSHDVGSLGLRLF
ncbi:hypothetical protein B0H19DRAFT_1070875 [Mycena capillaripes]|nr:hypothetical protein B0H19DRAFT_1070875 [Mycena capillaripes]